MALGVVAEVTNHIGPKGANIRQPARVGYELRIADRSIVFFDLPLFLLHVVPEQEEVLEPLDVGVLEEAYRVHVDVDGAFDPPPSRLRHRPPVLERIA